MVKHAPFVTLLSSVWWQHTEANFNKYSDNQSAFSRLDAVHMYTNKIEIYIFEFDSILLHLSEYIIIGIVHAHCFEMASIYRVF